VVDASLVVKWVLDEEDSDEARALREHWSSIGIQPAAPRLLIYEFADILRANVRRGQTTIEGAREALTELIAYDIEIIDMASIHARAIRLATQLSQGAVYDSHYLALAEHLDCEFWTADLAFARAATRITERVRVLASR